MSNVQRFLDGLSSYRENTAFAGISERVSYNTLLEKVSEYRAWIDSNEILKFEKVAILGDFNHSAIALLLALFENNNLVIPFSSNSVIELDRALAISGCDWIIDFTEPHPAATKRRESANHQLFDQLVASESPGLMLFSSGSTGTPKGILHNFDKILARFEKPGKQNTAIPLLMFDHYGGYNTIIGLLSSGSTIVEVKNRSVDSICQVIEREKVTLLPATPSFLSLLVASNSHLKYDLTSIRKITYGTEVMPESLLNKLYPIFPGVSLQQTYGLSEVGVLSSKSKSNDSTWVKVGGNGFETKVIDGILWIKSDFSMLGYVGVSDSKTDMDGWFNTEDRVEVEGDFIRILGRDSDLINVGGQKVLPIEVEEVLLSHESVSGVRVSSEPHNLLGQIVVAEIVARSGQNPSKQELKAFCRGRLSSFKVPQKIEFVDEIPLSPRLKKLQK